jgi:uncharacterized protein (TIGR02145 family)
VPSAIKGKSGGSVVQHHIKLPCVECFWNGDTAVVINGVTWATRNVDAPGTFAASPESYGMYYQWDRSTGWYNDAPYSALGTLKDGGTTTSWDNTRGGHSGTTWESAKDPSPAGWRVPTKDELNTLLETDKVSRERTACHGVNGYLFTDKTTGKSLFLPAAGYLNQVCGCVLYDDNAGGNYWSSIMYDEYDAYYLDFDYINDGSLPGECTYGFSVRSVLK